MTDIEKKLRLAVPITKVWAALTDSGVIGGWMGAGGLKVERIGWRRCRPGWSQKTSVKLRGSLAPCGRRSKQHRAYARTRRQATWPSPAP
jgi:hypothetical protein